MVADRFLTQEIRRVLFVVLGAAPVDGWCAVSIVSAMRAADRASQQAHHEVLRELLYQGEQDMALTVEEVQAHTASLDVVGEVIVLAYQWLDSWLTLLEVE